MYNKRCVNTRLWKVYVYAAVIDSDIKVYDTKNKTS